MALQSRIHVERRWKPHSLASRGSSIMRLLREVIDPPVAGYIVTLPEYHLSFTSGVGKGMLCHYIRISH